MTNALLQFACPLTANYKIKQTDPTKIPLISRWTQREGCGRSGLRYAVRIIYCIMTREVHELHNSLTFVLDGSRSEITESSCVVSINYMCSTTSPRQKKENVLRGPWGALSYFCKSRRTSPIDPAIFRSY